jgi:hypothetical protein
LTTTLDTEVAALRAVCGRFDDDANAAKMCCLGRLHSSGLRESKALLDYHACLLYLCAHPSDAAMLGSAEAELRRLAAFLKPRRGRHSE